MHFIQAPSLSSWIAFDLQLACMWTLRFGGGKILEIFYFFDVTHDKLEAILLLQRRCRRQIENDIRERDEERECGGGGGITSTASKRHPICVIAWHEDYSTRAEESSVYFWLYKLRPKCDIMKMKKDLCRQLAHNDRGMQFSDETNATATIADTSALSTRCQFSVLECNVSEYVRN